MSEPLQVNLYCFRSASDMSVVCAYFCLHVCAYYCLSRASARPFICPVLYVHVCLCIYLYACVCRSLPKTLRLHYQWCFCCKNILSQNPYDPSHYGFNDPRIQLQTQSYQPIFPPTNPLVQIFHSLFFCALFLTPFLF